jgi:hypothetical protein
MRHVATSAGCAAVCETTPSEEGYDLFAAVSPPGERSMVAGKYHVVSLARQASTRQLNHAVRRRRDDPDLDATRFRQPIYVAVGSVRKVSHRRAPTTDPSAQYPRDVRSRIGWTEHHEAAQLIRYPVAEDTAGNDAAHAVPHDMHFSRSRSIEMTSQPLPKPCGVLFDRTSRAPVAPILDMESDQPKLEGQPDHDQTVSAQSVQQDYRRTPRRRSGGYRVRVVGHDCRASPGKLSGFSW